MVVTNYVKEPLKYFTTKLDQRPAAPLKVAALLDIQRMSASGMLIASFLTDGVYRGHFSPEQAVHEASVIASSILESIRNPGDEVSVRAARSLNIFQQMRPLTCSHDMAVEEICRVVPAPYLCLFAVEVPSIPIDTYIERLVSDMRCGLECFVMALVLILRCTFCIPVCGRSLHRVILTSVIIAAKTRDDKYYPMSFYAKIGGTTKREVESMEIAMLDMLGFDARVPTPTYVDMIYSLRMHCSTLAYVRKCEWAGRAWSDFIGQLPVPRVADLIGEIQGLRSSTYSASCDFTIHNRIAANYSELQHKPLTSPIPEDYTDDSSLRYNPVLSPVDHGPSSFTIGMDSPRVDAFSQEAICHDEEPIAYRKSHRRTVSHPARMVISGVQWATDGGRRTHLGAISVPASAHITHPKHIKSPSVSLVRPPLFRSKSQLSFMSPGGSPLTVFGGREAARQSVFSMSPSHRRPSLEFDVSRSCPVERRTEPFVDPCWNLSVSISASTATAAASASAHVPPLAAAPLKDAAPLVPGREGGFGQSGSPQSVSTNGPSPYCSTEGPSPFFLTGGHPRF